MQRLGLSFLLMGILGCGAHEKPNFTYMPDMAQSPGYKAQEPQYGAAGDGMRSPVKGTVARNSENYTIESLEEAGRTLKNPLRRTREVLKRGQEVYNVYCVVCHGTYGEGDGPITPKFPRPPSLQSDKIRNYSDGALFHIMTRGQNIMPSYALQILPDDRWAVAHFIRALHRAKNPSKDDLKRAEDW